MDQQDVFHRFLLLWRLVASKTNGERENGHGHRSTQVTLVGLVVHERLRLRFLRVLNPYGGAICCRTSRSEIWSSMRHTASVE